MAIHIPIGKKGQVTLYKKDLMIIVVFFLVVSFGLIAYSMSSANKETSEQSSKTTDTNDYSLTDGYFYQSLGSYQYKIKFNYPQQWGDVEYSTGFFEGEYSNNKGEPIVGRYAFGSFTENKGVFFVARSPEYNASPETVEDNINFYSSLEVDSSILKLVYEQVGATGCLGDGEEDDSSYLFCPTGREQDIGLDTLLFNISSVQYIGDKRYRLLPNLYPPEANPDKLISEHIAVIDLPKSIFGGEQADLYAVAFVNINDQKLPDQDFLNTVKAVELL